MSSWEDHSHLDRSDSGDAGPPVNCPLCGAAFPQAFIEQHAATCTGGSGGNDGAAASRPPAAAAPAATTAAAATRPPQSDDSSISDDGGGSDSRDEFRPARANPGTRLALKTSAGFVDQVVVSGTSAGRLRRSSITAKASAAPPTEAEQQVSAAPLPKLECPVCMDEYAMDAMHFFEGCGHAYCRECVTAHVEQKVKDGQVLEIACMDPTCKSKLLPMEIKEFTKAETYAKWEEFALMATLRSDPNVRFCPKTDCRGAVIGDGTTTKLTCACGMTFCANCNREWHTGTCEQFDEWKAENNEVDRKFAEWAKKNSKPCPNCKARIEKNDGCNHMTCTRCRGEFCWLCGRAIEGTSHFDPWNLAGCPGMQFGRQAGRGRTEICCQWFWLVCCCPVVCLCLLLCLPILIPLLCCCCICCLPCLCCYRPIRRLVVRSGERALNYIIDQ